MQEETTSGGVETTVMEYFGWDYFEYPRYNRGRLWYVGMGLAAVTLLIYAVASANFLFAFIIIMFALIMYLTTVTEPSRIRFSITPAGLRVGKSFYPYRDVARFWFIYEPPEVKNLYLELKNPLVGRLVVDLDGTNPNDVRSVLGRFLREDLSQEDEPMADFIGRILKI